MASRLGAMDFPQRLADLRRKRGLTQEALATRAGVHVTQLRRYEAGVAEPSLRTIRGLAVSLSVTADELIFGARGRVAPDEELALAFEATVHLPPADREAVKAMLDAFLARHLARDGREGPRAARKATSTKS